MRTEDAKAQVVAKGQKQDLGKGYYKQRRQRTIGRTLSPGRSPGTEIGSGKGLLYYQQRRQRTTARIMRPW